MPGVSLTQYTWSKWLLALIIGFPTIGCAYYYYTKTVANKECKPKKLKKGDESLSTEKPVEENSISESHASQSQLDRALSLKSSGNKFFRERKYSDAIKCYTEALDLCPSEEKDHLSAVYQNRAAAYESLGNLEEVVKNCTEAIKLKPLYLKALSRRSKACEKLGQLRQSLEDVTTCCYVQHFNNEDDIINADRILKKIGAEEAEKYIKNKPLVMPSKEFIEHCLNSLVNDPLKDFLTVKNHKSEATLQGFEAAKKYLREGDYKAVFSACNDEINAVRETSKEPSLSYYQALLLRGTMYVLMNESVRAKADLENIIDSTEADPSLKVSALLKRACIYMQSEEAGKAFEDFDKAELLLPNNSDIYHQKAQMLLLSDSAEAAVVEFEKAHSLNPDFPLVQIQKLFTEYKIAVKENNRKKVEFAKMTLKNLVDENPKLLEGYLLLSQIYNELQEFKKSEDLMNQAITADPTNPTILVHRGLLYMQWKGNFEQAVKDMQKAISLDPKCGFAYETLASVEVQRGNLLTAITYFDKALPLTKSVKEAAHILSLKIAAQTQHTVSSSIAMQDGSLKGKSGSG